MLEEWLFDVMDICDWLEGDDDDDGEDDDEDEDEDEEVRPSCKGLLSKYEPISDASQVPVDSSLMINFPILVIKQNFDINILIDFLIRTLSFSLISWLHKLIEQYLFK